MSAVAGCCVTVSSLRAFFFFSSRRRHTRCYRDWSSDVCSSDLDQILVQLPGVTDVDRAKEIIGSPGMLELKLVEQGPAANRGDLLRSTGGGAPAAMAG